jgi:acyl carrier protein
MSATDSTSQAEEILAWAQVYLADLLGSDPVSLDPDTDFDQLGIDSALAVSLLTEIEERYGVDLPPESLFENPTLGAVARSVQAQLTPATP